MKHTRLPSWLHLPISARLTLWYGLTLLILLSLFAVFCYTNFHLSLHRDFDRHLTHEKRELMPFVRLEGARPTFATLDEVRSVAYRTDGIYGTYVRLLTPGGEVLYRSPNFEGHPPLPVSTPRAAEEEVISREWEAKPARTQYTPLIGEAGVLQGWLEVTGFEWSLHRELYRLGWTLAVGILLSVLLAIAGGYWLARRALRPVAALTETANRIGASDLQARLPTDFGVRDELTELAETLNGLIARLAASLGRERRLTANAAHELLTPLATLRNGVEAALRREGEAGAYRETLRGLMVDLDRMSATVHDLLQLSQADRLEHVLREPVDLGAVSTEHVARHRRRGEARGIDLRARAAPGVQVDADAAHLGEVLDNLLDNALKYTPEGGSVTVQVEGDAEEARLLISDTGAGFEPGEAEHLFDRFYRSDASDIQAQPGSGLGLAIAKAVVNAFGGTITAQSNGSRQGSTFEVRFPRQRGQVGQ